jgi:sulfur transfer protein SufE
MDMLHESFKKAWDHIIGFIEIAKHKTEHYKYVIEDIELKKQEDKLCTYIRYKLIGCRSPLYGYAQELNNTHIFSLFKPDHAQFIVSIATVEAVLDKSPDEIIEKYKQYVNHVGLKIKAKKFS